MKKLHAAAALCALLGACAERPASAAAPEAAATPAPDAVSLLDAAIAGEHRTPEEKARDIWRHPKETLTFFGVEPGMTVVEIWPGGGWYTKILAPYLKTGGGVYYAAQRDPASSARAAEAVQKFKDAYADENLYGAINVTVLGEGFDVAPEGTADVVLTFRNVHNWTSAGQAEANFKAFFRALKPGGVLGVVEHRANEGADEDPDSGYVRESTVKALAEAAGFEFVEASEINANPKDTKDHPFGVWTLPPVRRSSESQGQEDPNFDRAKYDAIGESDRMTLKFVKPKS
jgi:predicted methyltransferase